MILSDCSVSIQPLARAHPAASRESALRPSGTIPAPATLDSMDQDVNMSKSVENLNSLDMCSQTAVTLWEISPSTLSAASTVLKGTH